MAIVRIIFLHLLIIFIFQKFLSQNKTLRYMSLNMKKNITRVEEH